MFMKPKKLVNLHAFFKNKFNVQIPIENTLKFLIWTCAFIAFFLLFQADDTGDLKKISFQFCLVGVFGGAIAWMFREYTRLREINESDRQELLSVTKEIVHAYNKIKEIRRILRARAQRLGEIGEETTIIKTDIYEEEMQNLNRLQLHCEGFKRRVRAEKKLFEKAKGLYSNLDKMEKYLNDVIDEYESALRYHAETPQALPANDLPKLSAFIAPRMENSEIQNSVLFAFRGTLKALTEALTDARLANSQIRSSTKIKTDLN